MMYQKELDIALSAVSAAARLCRGARQTLVDAESVSKKDRSPVTIADFGSQAIISLALGAAFPNDPIVGEEDAAILRENDFLRRKVHELVAMEAGPVEESPVLEAIDRGAGEVDFSKRFWTVDPIDGTKGFLRGEQYAVALALVEGGRVVLGVLGCPNFSVGGAESGGALFYAVAGGGAFSAPIGDRDMAGHALNALPIRVDETLDPALARFCESLESGHSDHETHQKICERLGVTAPPCRMDSQAKYAAVASGGASIYLRLPRGTEYREKIWDHAAGALIVEAAGGRVTDFSGNALSFASGRTLEGHRGILATNGRLHDKVLQAIEASVML
ncbi:3'(2'),5'-bisphosphate nucleotidase [Desulfococcus sp.]|uniref:3'(2'),5'-bisphosphate nucleotidase n=1 Tax=Desulfococcus sp. TaxID=2025834 RepID=UPI0035947031